MARTPAQAKALEAKALKEDNKSEGMRMLLDADYSVADVAKIFDVKYGFAYGVARRAAGGVAPAGAERRQPKAAKAPAKKATATKAATAAKAPARAAKAPAKAAAKTASKARK